MVIEDTTVAIKIGYILAWAFIASYYFVWRGDETVHPTSYVDESGWVSDGAYAQIMTEKSPSPEE